MPGTASPLPLGYFGRAGSFSHLAALRRFPQAHLAECPTVEEAFERLRAGEFAQIVVPIENASSGIITNTGGTCAHGAARYARDHENLFPPGALRP
jgi:prephenate dehydratase